MTAAAVVSASPAFRGHALHLVAGVVPILAAVIVVIVERLRDRTPSADDYLARPAARALLSADSFGISPNRLAPRVPRARTASKRPAQPLSVTLAVAALVAAAGVHVTVMPRHFEESWLYGAFFLGTASAQVAAALLIWRRPSRWRLGAIGAASLGVVLLWAWTRLVGVPLGPGAGETEAIGPLDVIATAAELVTAACCFVATAVPATRPARI